VGPAFFCDDLDANRTKVIYDTGKQGDPAWSPIFSFFEPDRAWLRKRMPDAIVYGFSSVQGHFRLTRASPFT